MTILETTTSEVVKSVTGKIRIQALDVIRGLAILGILAVNADGFTVPQAASLKPLTWPYPNEVWTAFSYWVMDTFFHDKFIAIFSMLFGVSLFLVGGDGSDAHKNRFLARRLAILLVFGLIHGFGVWWGDILSLYAATGFLMFFCRSWQPRRLLVAGTTLYLAMAASQMPPTALPFASSQARVEVVRDLVPDSETIAAKKAKINEDMQTAKASWTGAYALNARQYRRVLSGDLRLIPQTLGLMMIGLSLFKSGFLSGKSHSRRYGVVIAIGSVALAVTGWLCWRQDVLERPILGGGSLLLMLGLVVALAFASALILGLRSRAAWILAPLAPAGRMAFTNYLTQSIIMTSIFYGGRGGLMGEIDRPGLWALTAGIWVLQLIWSSLWLSRYEMGPFEWIWRSLTVGGLVPLRKRR